MFDRNNLSALAYANGFSTWHYRTTDGWDDLTYDYFQSAADWLRSGDFVFVNLSDGNFTAFFREDERGVLAFDYY